MNRLFIRKDDQTMIMSDIRDGNELLLHSHELAPSKTRTTDDQGEQHVQFIVDYDQTSNKRNLIDDKQSNDEGSNPDLNSNTAPISYLPMDQYFEIVSTADGTDEQETILYSKSSRISLFSDNIDHPSLSDNQGTNRLNYFSAIYIYLVEDQFKPKENVSDGMIIYFSSSAIVTLLVRDLYRDNLSFTFNTFVNI